MSDEEVSEMIDIILNGTNLSKDQKKYNLLTRTRDYALIMLFLGTGMRISECVGIDVNDIDLKLNAVLVTRKGGNSEILYYPEQVAEALAMYLSEREQIVPLPGHENAMFLSMQRKRRYFYRLFAYLKIKESEYRYISQLSNRCRSVPGTGRSSSIVFPPLLHCG